MIKYINNLKPYAKAVVACEPVIGFALHHMVKHGGHITADGWVNILIGLIGVMGVALVPNKSTEQPATTDDGSTSNAYG